jgi:hypothetical protein
MDPFSTVNTNIVRGNDDIMRRALNTHTADPRMHVQSSSLTNRPAAGVTGRLWVTADTTAVRFWYDTGSEWIEIRSSSSYYGSFYDTTTQSVSVINTATLMTLNSTDIASGVSVVSGSRMTVATAGTYNFQWSGQFINADSQIQDVDVWIRINGTDLVGSTGTISVPNKHGAVNGTALPSWNYYLMLNAGDYVQLYWASTHLSVTVQANAANSVHPSTASLIATMTKV